MILEKVLSILENVWNIIQYTRITNMFLYLHKCLQIQKESMKKSSHIQKNLHEFRKSIKFHQMLMISECVQEFRKKLPSLKNKPEILKIVQEIVRKILEF